MSTSASGSGCSTPSTHPSDDEWEEVINNPHLPETEFPKSSITASGSSKSPFKTDMAKLSAMQNVFLCTAQHVDWVKNPKEGSRTALIEVIGEALYDHDFNPTDIVNYIGKTPRSLPTGEELIKLKELHHSRDSNGKQYGEKRPALNLCEELMNLCIDVYLDVDSSLSTWKEETKDNKDVPAATRHTTAHSLDDEWEKLTNISPLSGIDLMKSSSGASGFSKRPSKTDTAKLAAMQNVFLFLKVHVDPLYQKPLSRKMMLEHISVALYDNDLNPTEIIDYIGKTPRNLPTGEELIKLRQFNQSRDSNGIQYGEKRPAALNLCEEVMNLCIDVYLGEVSPDTREEETQRIKVASAATTHTTAEHRKGKGKEMETKFNPTEEFMKHATPSLKSTSYHLAKRQAFLSPLRGTDENIPKPPKVIAPTILPQTASAPSGISQDRPTLLAMAKEIRVEADLVKKKLNKSTAKESQAEAQLVKREFGESTAASNEQLLAKKPRALDNVVSQMQLPSTHGEFKDENRPISTQSKQKNSPFENPKIFAPSFTNGELDNEPMEPLYTRSGAKEASLWKADMIHATHGLPTQKCFAQQLSDKLDNPPYVDRASSASLWSKKNMAESVQPALLANGPKSGDVVMDGTLVGNVIDLNHRADITDAAATVEALTPTQRFERSDDIAKDGKRVRKIVSVESEMRRIAEIAKADAKEKAAEALALAFSPPTGKFEKPSLLAVRFFGSKQGDTVKDGKLAKNTDDSNRHTDIEMKIGPEALAAFAPTQKLHKLSQPAANIHGSKPKDVLENGKVVSNIVDTVRNAETFAVETLAASTPTQKFEKPSLPALTGHEYKPTHVDKDSKVVGNTVDLNRLAALQRGKERFDTFQRQRDATLAALTPTQKFEKMLTDHAISKMLAGGDTLAPAGHPNTRLTTYLEGMKHAAMPEIAVEKNAAPKHAEKVQAVKEQFKQGPVTPPTKVQFEQGRVTPQKRETVAPAKKEVQRATWTQNGDREPAHLIKIAMVPVGLLMLCTFIQIIPSLGTIMSAICNVVAHCLALFMDCTRYFWFGTWWLITAPFLFFGYVGGLIGGMVSQAIGPRPGHAAAPSDAPPFIIEPGPSTIPTIQETITLWEILGKEKANGQPQCENSVQISSELSADSSSGIRYKSAHRIGNSGWRTESDYPFTRHNNSMPEADRCEHFVKSFQHFWKEEMEEKKEKEEKEGMFDLALGNDLAEVLSRYCK